MAAFEASIRVRGVKELDALLRQLPEDVAGPIMLDALLAGGEVIHTAASQNIHSRTGKTAADLRVEVQVAAEKREGAAGVGATPGRSGRAHVLRWLEFGTSAHRVIAGAKDRKLVAKAVRVLNRFDRSAAAAVKARVAGGSVKITGALKLPGGIFRASANHPGSKNQSPLTRALSENADRIIAVFRDTLWQGIVGTTKKLRKAA